MYAAYQSGQFASRCPMRCFGSFHWIQHHAGPLYIARAHHDSRVADGNSIMRIGTQKVFVRDEGLNTTSLQDRLHDLRLLYPNAVSNKDPFLVRVGYLLVFVVHGDFVLGSLRFNQIRF